MGLVTVANAEMVDCANPLGVSFVIRQDGGDCALSQQLAALRCHPAQTKGAPSASRVECEVETSRYLTSVACGS